MSNHLDELTGVLRKRVLIERINELLVEAAEAGTTLSLVLMDLDLFKEFNDTHGHMAGDELISSFAKILQANCRTSDLVGRYGGEEFILAMPDTYPEEALLMMEDLLRQVSQTTHKFQAGKHEFEHQYTFSGGVSAFPRDGSAFEELMQAADKALYRAKINGRNRLALAVKERTGR